MSKSSVFWRACDASRAGRALVLTTVALAPALCLAQPTYIPRSPVNQTSDNAGAEWVGFENSTVKDRENELRSLVGQFRRVTAEGDFVDLCRSIGKECVRVRDWEGADFTCEQGYNGRHDATRLALCKLPQPSAVPGPNASGPLPPLPTLPVPVYAFDGASAAYNLRSGSVLVPFTETISDVDSVRQKYRFSTVLGGAESHMLRAEITDFGQRFSALSRSELNSIRQGTAPQGFPWPVLSIRHTVAVPVPAGKFITEQVALKSGYLWFDATSGVLVKAIGRDPVTSIFGDAQNLLTDPNATAELTKTNLQMSAVPSSNASPLLFGAAAGGLVVLVAIIGFALMRRARRGRLLPAPASSPAARTPQPAVPLPAAKSPGADTDDTLPVRPAAPVSLEALEKLAKLKSLVDTGVITREEFDREKAKLLG